MCGCNQRGGAAAMGGVGEGRTHHARPQIRAIKRPRGKKCFTSFADHHFHVDKSALLGKISTNLSQSVRSRGEGERLSRSSTAAMRGVKYEFEGKILDCDQASYDGEHYFLEKSRSNLVVPAIAMLISCC